MDKRYLGDGAYVQSSAFGDIELTTENGISVQNRVVLGPTEIAELEQFIKEWREESV